MSSRRLAFAILTPVIVCHCGGNDGSSDVDASDGAADSQLRPDTSTSDDTGTEGDGSIFPTEDVGPDVAAAAAACGRKWSLHEYVAGHAINGIATDGKIYVAAGECAVANTALDCGTPKRFGGLIMTSADGHTGWKVQQSKATLSLKSIVYAAGQFVAVGNKKLIVTSPDGVDWTLRMGPGATTDPAFYGVVHDGKQFVVVGSSGNGCTSPDGVTWSCHVTPSAQPDFRALCTSKGKFYGVGANGWVATSTDGVSWDPKQIGSTNLYGVACGSERVVTGGQDGVAFRTDDGTTWTPITTTFTNYWMAGTYVPTCGVYVFALGWGTGPSDSLAVSLDGIAFDQVFTETKATHGLLGVFYDGHQLLSHGGYSSLHSSSCPCTP